jgi:hypothetical protein
MFCAVTAPECRHKIADLAVGFLRDDCVVRFPPFAVSLPSLHQAHLVLFLDSHALVLKNSNASASACAQAE